MTKSAACKIRKTKAKIQGRRLAARDLLYALDNALQAVGSGLKTFFQDAACRPGSLSKDERRFTQRDKRPEEQCCVPLGVEKRRMCVEDKRTGKRRFEAPEYTGLHPVLTLVADEEPAKYPALWYLSQKGYRVRGSLIPSTDFQTTSSAPLWRPIAGPCY